LSLRYKVVLLVALAAALWIVGQWVIVEASPFPSGWVGYAPLQVTAGPGLHPWVQAVIWLALIGVWTLAALLLLGDSKVDAKRES
jgi:hypothetical protein